MGTSTASCSASDGSGNGASCTTSVTIVDTKAPTLSVVVSPSVLGPKSHKLVPISITTRATDACDRAPAVTCAVAEKTAVSSFAPDVVWKNGQLYLRAVHGPRGGEREYLVTCVARDASGNATSSSATVVVQKHSQGEGPDDDD